jgi:hypothetical protein
MPLGAKAGEGDLWVPLSPWYKPYEYDNGVDLVTMSGFDTETYLNDFISDVKPESPVYLYKLYFEDYLKANNPGMNWQDGLITRKIKADLKTNLDYGGHVVSPNPPSAYFNPPRADGLLKNYNKYNRSFAILA